MKTADIKRSRSSSQSDDYKYFHSRIQRNILLRCETEAMLFFHSALPAMRELPIRR